LGGGHQSYNEKQNTSTILRVEPHGTESLANCGYRHC
jgi:hypothetical protein